jgi:hypothetical protein
MEANFEGMFRGINVDRNPPGWSPDMALDWLTSLRIRR